MALLDGRDSLITMGEGLDNTVITSWPFSGDVFFVRDTRDCKPGEGFSNLEIDEDFISGIIADIRGVLFSKDFVN